MAAPGVAQALKAVVVHLGQAVVLRLVLGPIELFLGQKNEVVQVIRVAHLEQVIREHRDERRRQGYGAAVGNAVRLQTLEHL